LTIAGAFSFLDTEITDVLTPTDDVVAGGELAFAPSFQGNIRVRYEFDLTNTLGAYIQPQLTHSASKFTDIIEINKIELDSYTVVDLAVGVERDSWSFEIFGDNLFDERAQISGNFINDRARIVVNRPLTVGMRVSYDY
jgi:outer membrane receptor protein involved in Fe transport